MTSNVRKTFFACVIVMAVVSCATNKKRRCNTCPKWEDRIEWTSQQADYEEQYQSGSRP